MRISRRNLAIGGTCIMLLVGVTWRIATLPSDQQDDAVPDLSSKSTPGAIPAANAVDTDIAPEREVEADAEYPRRNYEALLKAAQRPDLGHQDAPANEAIKTLATTYDQAVLIPKDAETILEHEYAIHRQAWYREHWLESFRRYGRMDAAWGSQVEDFLEQSSVARTDGPEISRADGIRLKQMASELLDAGCDDPLVQSVLLEVLPISSPESISVSRQLFASFLKSAYPAKIALWAGCPFVTAEQVLRIQDKRRGLDGADLDSPFDVPDPLEARLLLEHFVSRYKLRFGNEPPQTDTRLLVAMETNSPVTPWLRHMIMAYHVSAGSLDADIMMEMAGRKAAPGSREFAELQAELKADLDFERKLVEARMIVVVMNHLLPAWHQVAENPEAATAILTLMETEGARLTTGPGNTPQEFWFTQALRAQIDYPPAFRQIFRYMTGESSMLAPMRMATECLDSQRFDTSVPARYPLYLKLITSSPFVPQSPQQRRELYSQGEVYIGLETLVRGYESRPPPGVDLNLLKTHLACAAYCVGDLKTTQRLIDELGHNYDAETFGLFQIVPRAIQVEAVKRKQNRPFRLANDGAAAATAFAPHVASLICLDDLGQLQSVDLSDGTARKVDSDGQRFSLIGVSTDGRHIVGFNGEETVIGELPSPTFVPVPKAGSLIPIDGDVGRRRYFATVDMQPGSEKLTLSLRDFNPASVVRAIETPFVRIDWAAISANDAVLAILGQTLGSGAEGPITHVITVRLDTGAQTSFKNPFNSSFDGVAINASGTALAIWGKDIVNNDYTQGVPFVKLAMLDIETTETIWAQYRGSDFKSAVFIEGDQRLISIEGDRLVRVWDCRDGAFVTSYFGHSAPIESCDYSSENSLLATGDAEGQIRVWDLRTDVDHHRAQGVLGQVRLPSVESVDIDPSTEDILTSSSSAGVVRWSKSSGYQAREAFPYGHVQWGPGGELTIIGSRCLQPDRKDPSARADYAVNVRRGGYDDIGATIAVESQLPPVPAMFPDGKSLALSGRIATVWNLQSGEPHRWGLLTANSGPISEIRVSDDGQRIATLSTPFSRKSAIRVWQVPDNPSMKGAACNIVFSLDAKDGRYTDIEISGDGKTLQINVDRKIVELWNVDTGLRVATFSGRQGAMNSDASKVAITQGDSKIQVYDRESMRLEQTLVISGHDAKNLRWLPGDRSLIFSTQGWISCLDIQSNAELIPIDLSADGDEE